jgi:hypothetical protein
MLIVVCLSLFLLTSLSDPGFIPRKEIQIALGIQNGVREALGIPTSNLVSPEKLYLSDDGKLIIENEIDERILLTEDLALQGYKFCQTCKIIRPPRSAHCSDCDNCCLRHDHHCPFVNNCIGHRNYVLFGSFILSAVLLGCMILLSVIMWVADGSDIFSPTTVRVIAFVVGVPVGLALLAGIAFFGYHAVLTVKGETTRENLRGRGSIQNPSALTSSIFSRPPRLYPSMRTIVRIPRIRTSP